MKIRQLDESGGLAAFSSFRLLLLESPILPYVTLFAAVPALYGLCP